jgi:hypothetical protein
VYIQVHQLGTELPFKLGFWDSLPKLLCGELAAVLSAFETNSAMQGRNLFRSCQRKAAALLLNYAVIRSFSIYFSDDSSCISFSFLWYWGLNSGSSPWATPPALFLWRDFQDRVSWTICPSWLQTLILLISASWVARIIGVECLALAAFLMKNPWDQFQKEVFPLET